MKESVKELVDYLNAIAAGEGWPLSLSCREYLQRIIETRSLKKGEFLLTKGQVCENLYFIEKGLVKCFYFVNRKPVSNFFFGDGETVVAIDSFYDQQPSEDNIQALEKCELLYIPYGQLIYLYKTFVEFNVLGRVFTNRYLRIWHTQLRNIRMLTAEERYLLMREERPDLISRVPGKDVASLLDMDKDTYSRMRSRFK